MKKRISSRSILLKSGWILLFVLGLSISAFVDGASFASERAKARLYPYANDLGPDQIDVSAYPPELQNTYRQLILGKCSRCHGAARVLNSEFADKDVWRLYIKRMAAKPGAEIEPAEAQKILDFVVYDSQQRKKGPQSAAWQAHRKSLLDAFKRKEPFRYRELYEAK